MIEENKKKLVGRIGGYALVSHILKTRERWLDGEVSEIMEALERPLQENDPLGKALQVFRETKFAFMPVASNDRIVASLSLRDLIDHAKGLKVEVQKLASPLLTIDKDASVLDALSFMVEKGVRNLVFLEQDIHPYVINDRKFLAYLLRSQTRELVLRRGFEVLATMKLSGLGAIKGIRVDPKGAAGSMAHFFSDIGTSCLFADGMILTPWDLVIKGLGLTG
ncbi:CBS domain-containing protein [Candidatus Nitrososphaera evergladensis]|nr:CBS domain-containing protein [Candidatus Nitrososphaera evergladensis]